MLFRDEPGRRIEDPMEYLCRRYPGQDFSVSESLSIAGALPPYYIREHNACALYATGAMLAFYLNRAAAEQGIGLNAGPGARRPEAFMGFPSYLYPLSASDLVPMVFDLYRDSGCDAAPRLKNYELDNVDYRYFTQLCLDRAGLKLKAHNSFRCWQKGIELLREKKPFMLNIWYADGGGYFNHSVVACGAAICKGGGKSFRFFQVRDGYSLGREPRWVLCGGNPVRSYITYFV